MKGKTAIVTGSTYGLGASIAKGLAREGVRVAVSGRSRDKGEAMAASLGNGSIYHPTDLTNPEDCLGLVDAAVKAFGGIDILVNSAADTRRSTVEDFTPELFEEQLILNLRAPLLMVQAALPSLKERQGVVINIGSINSYVGEPTLLIYSATKGALQTASRNLANALKFERVRVYCLNAGWMDTEGERKMMKKLGRPDDFLDKTGSAFPLGRIMKPEEVAEVAVFMASDKAAAFSGTVIELEQFPVGPLSIPAREGGITEIKP